MAAIAEKRDRLLAGRQPQTARLGPYQAAVDRALAEMKGNRVMARIWAHDHTVWKPEPTEITDRLAWLDVGRQVIRFHLGGDVLGRLRRLREAVG